jgi:hypothetical protein
MQPEPSELLQKASDLQTFQSPATFRQHGLSDHHSPAPDGSGLGDCSNSEQSSPTVDNFFNQETDHPSLDALDDLTESRLSGNSKPLLASTPEGPVIGIPYRISSDAEPSPSTIAAQKSVPRLKITDLPNGSLHVSAV